MKRENLLYLLLSAVLVVGGYFFLRYAYHISDRLPFTQEIMLIVLGTIVTVMITAMLLNKQTEVELRKEENIKFLELKTGIYFDLLQRIEEILLAGHSTPQDLIRMRFLTHRLSLVASPEVLEQYESFVRKFQQAASDQAFAIEEENEIDRELARLSVHIRQDLVGELDERSTFSRKRISDQIMENVRLQRIRRR
ncbi:MAG TPA: hypothetical protein ENI96_04130 [Sedimenticola thiotaurini]|uniref:Uncharacterized protein n=1 Tax=Sedimenticola thiotaurini TaxID=1543721 RepID=A0A831RJ61_9GAMM|nr:hypothetical protein [Sedimenticola thiotaurini]